tara:strand:- start:1054 stop:1719 length:666 start_codon:yes stop_codon:yes gene_type:complete
MFQDLTEPRGETRGLMMADKAHSKDDEQVTIKKYANRRLYNTATSSYVTLDHLAQMVKNGIDFVVFDAKTGEDITRSVLTHIIVEEESKGPNLLPIDFLRHLITFYGDSLQAVVPNYLDHTMHAFARNQEQMRGAMQDALGELNPFGQFEEIGKQNMAMFENAMKMFVPFYGANDAQATNDSASPTATADAEGKGAVDELEALKAQLAQMQVQLDRMSGDK